MALTLVTGAEAGINVVGGGTGKPWAGISGAVGIETTVIRSGSKSYRFAAASTRPYFDRGLTAGNKVAYFRGYVYVTDATPSAEMTFMDIDQAAGSDMNLKLSTGGVLFVCWGTNSGQVDGPTLANSTWYGVELELDCTADPNLINWRTWDATDGWVDQTTASFAQAATALNGMKFGIFAGGPTSGMTVYWDDILEGSSAAAGADYDAAAPKGGRVLRYRPTADGAHAFTDDDFLYDNTTGILAAATDVYTYLDDDDQTDLTDYISQNVAWSSGTKAATVTFADEATETQPRAVSVVSAHHSDGTGGNEINIRVSDDGTNWTNVWGNWAGTGNDVSDTTIHPRQLVLNAKPSGGAWTAAAVNGMTAQFGQSNDVSAVPFYDSISLEVEWTEATGGSTVTPGVVALTLATFAPDVILTDNVTVTPGVAALTTAMFAPVVTASDHQLVTPGVVALTTALFAPTVATSDHKLVTPPVVALATNLYAPTVVTSDHKVATPPAASLSLAAFAPTVAATAHQTVTPDTIALTTSLFAPVVTASDHQSVTPGVVALTLSAFAATVTATASDLLLEDGTGGYLLEDNSGVLDLEDIAPLNITATPDVASLSLTAFAPIVPVTAHQTVTPDTASLVLTTYEPDLSGSENQAAVPTTAGLTLAGLTPTVAVTDHKTVVADVASLALSAFAPTVTATDHQTATPPAASLALATFAPVVMTTAHQTVTPTAASLALTAFAPNVVATDQQVATPPPASLTLTGFAPTVATTANVWAIPTTTALSLTAFAPGVVASDHRIVIPTTAALSLAGFAPDVAVLVILGLAAQMRITSGSAEQMAIASAPGMSIASVSDTPVIRRAT